MDADRSAVTDHRPGESVGLPRIVRRPELQEHLVLGSDVDRRVEPALSEVPEMKPVAVFVREQVLGHDPVLELLRRAPFAAHQHVLSQVPPEVIGEFLRSTMDFPGTDHVETEVVQQEDASRTVRAVRRTQRADVDRVGAAMYGVGPAVPGPFHEVVGLDDLDDVRRGGVRPGIHNVNARRAKTRQDQVAPFQVGMWRVGTQRRTAGVPAEVVEFVPHIGHVEGVNRLTVRRRLRIKIDNAKRIRPIVHAGIERRYVTVPFGRGLHGHFGRRIEGRVRFPERHFQLAFFWVIGCRPGTALSELEIADGLRFGDNGISTNDESGAPCHAAGIDGVIRNADVGELGVGFDSV